MKAAKVTNSPPEAVMYIAVYAIQWSYTVSASSVDTEYCASFFPQSRSRQEDPEQLRLKQKAKEVRVQAGVAVYMVCVTCCM